MLIILQFSSVVYAQRKQAFMVGISHYDTALTGYQWNNINGVEDINLLRPILQKQGFQLTILLDEQATYNNIISQLTQFIKKTQKGDIVYFHFSTHGQPVEDLDGDEVDGWDEAIIPIDAYKLFKKGSYEGKNHLLDDQLNIYIKKLRERIGPSGFLYVIVDACHAGTASRGYDETIRGTRIGFTYNQKVFKPSISQKTHYKLEASAKMANVIFIEACRSDQTNTEIKVAGKQYGALSYHIAKTLNKTSLALNADDFLKSLKSTILNEGYWPNNQNMVIETSY